MLLVHLKLACCSWNLRAILKNSSTVQCSRAQPVQPSSRAPAGRPCLQCLPKHPCALSPQSPGARACHRAAFWRELLLNGASLEVPVGTWAPLQVPVSISFRFLVFLLHGWLQLDFCFFHWIHLRHQQHPFGVSFKYLCIEKPLPGCSYAMAFPWSFGASEIGTI